MKNIGFLIGLFILGGISFLKREKILPKKFMSSNFDYKLPIIIVLSLSVIIIGLALFIFFF